MYSSVPWKSYTNQRRCQYECKDGSESKLLEDDDEWSSSALQRRNEDDRDLPTTIGWFRKDGDKKPHGITDGKGLGNGHAVKEVIGKQKSRPKLMYERVERDLTVVNKEGQESKITAAQKVAKGRETFFRDRFKRVPVYDEPIGVVNNHVLSGERDRRFWEERMEEESKLTPTRVPVRLQESHGFTKENKNTSKFLNRLKVIQNATAKSYFRLRTDKSQEAASRIQGWWRCVLARGKMAKLRELFIVTDYDPATGLWFRKNLKTGIAKWII